MTHHGLTTKANSFLISGEENRTDRTKNKSKVQAISPHAIRGVAHIYSSSQIMDVHLGMKHLADGSSYTPDSFGKAVTVRDEDMAWMAKKERHLKGLCHESWASLSRWKPYS